MAFKKGKKKYAKISIMIRKQFINKVIIQNFTIKEVLFHLKKIFHLISFSYNLGSKSIQNKLFYGKNYYQTL